MRTSPAVPLSEHCVLSSYREREEQLSAHLSGSVRYQAELPVLSRHALSRSSGHRLGDSCVQVLLAVFFPKKLHLRWGFLSCRENQDFLAPGKINQEVMMFAIIGTGGSGLPTAI